MSSRFAEVRYALRDLLDQIVGYCDVLLQHHGAASERLLAAVSDLHAIAKSVASSLEAPKLNARQIENVGRRALVLSDYIGRRAADLEALAAREGQLEVSADLGRLRASAERLLPFAKELILEHEMLAARNDPQRGVGQPAVAPQLNVVTRSSRAAPLLIVDDNENNRELLGRRLAQAGYSSIVAAGSGRAALELLNTDDFDLVLLDVMMPDISGIDVLRTMKQDPRLQHVPVVMISAVDDVSSVAECISLGAEDYLPKPFEQVILQARIRGSLERKRLRDEDKRRTKELEQALLQIDRARRVSEDLLRNILPSAVAEELQERNAVEPVYFEDVTIAFADFVSFAAATEALSAEELVSMLHAYFTGMDNITEKYGLEKLKTIGDCYMFAAGLPERNPAHPVDTVLAALEILQFVDDMRTSGRGADWRIRIGIHTGPVIAGVVGVRKFAFDVWGETVNMASRVESHGTPDVINLSERTYSRVKDFFTCEHRGKVPIKDGEEVDMYTVQSVQPKLLAEPGTPPSAFARRYRTYFKNSLEKFPAFLSTGNQ